MSFPDISARKWEDYESWRDLWRDVVRKCPVTQLKRLAQWPRRTQPLMGDKIITPGTHVTHRKNIQPMNKSWYFYAFWLFFQQFSDRHMLERLRRINCLWQSSVLWWCCVRPKVYNFTEIAKTPIKSSDFLLHPLSFLVLPLLGFMPQQWPSKVGREKIIYCSFKHSQNKSLFQVHFTFK